MSEVKTEKAKSILNNRFVRPFVAGIFLSLLSWVILGFNLSTATGIRITDDVNRYFDTCVLEGFVEATPRISTEERGFPLAWHQKDFVPVCDTPTVQLKTIESNVIDWGALGANILFWSAVAFLVQRKFILRKRLRISQEK